MIILGMIVMYLVSFLKTSLVIVLNAPSLLIVNAVYLETNNRNRAHHLFIDSVSEKENELDRGIEFENSCRGWDFTLK